MGFNSFVTKSLKSWKVKRIEMERNSSSLGKIEKTLLFFFCFPFEKITCCLTLPSHFVHVRRKTLSFNPRTLLTHQRKSPRDLSLLSGGFVCILVYSSSVLSQNRAEAVRA